MKSLLKASSHVVATVLALQLTASSLHAQIQRVSTSTPAMKQTIIQKDPTVKNADIGPASTVTGLPLADLVIKDAYLDEYAGFPFVNFLIANAGQKDAGHFQVSIRYNYKPGSDVGGRYELYPVDTLKAGESTWVSASPLCCGWAGTEMVVANTFQFEVIADPKYSKWDPLDPYNPAKVIEVKSEVPESNKRNNKFVINKADMRHGKMIGTMTKTTAAPAIGTIKPPVPVTKH